MIFGLAPRAVADGPATPARIAVRFEEPWPDALRRAVRFDLEATIGRQGFVLVDAGDAIAAAATLRLRAPTPAQPRCEVQLEDHVTDKHVERTVSLNLVPPDSWSVAIAAGADELLRASWLELALPGAPEPAIEPPAEVTQWVENVVAEEIVPRYEASRVESAPIATFGIRAAVSGFWSGQLQLGGDLLSQLWLADFVAIELAAGARAALETATVHGTIRCWSVAGELGPVFALLPRASPFRLQAFVTLRAAYVAFDATPSGGARVTPVDGAAVYARVGVRGALGLDDHQLGLELALGIPVLAFEVSDGRNVLDGMSGLEIHGAIVWAIDVAR